MLNNTKVKPDDQSGDRSKPFARGSAAQAAVCCTKAKLAHSCNPEKKISRLKAINTKKKVYNLFEFLCTAPKYWLSFRTWKRTKLNSTVQTILSNAETGEENQLIP